MPVIKAVLREELQNAEIMKHEYEKALAGLPRGALVRKIIRGRPYYYLMERKGGKICFKYIGKLDENSAAEYDKRKKMRAKYRNLLSGLKKRIKYLKGVLRGKEEI